MKRLFFFLLFLSFFLLNAHAQNQPHHRKANRSPASARKNTIRYGTASFYARKFNGRKTASGVKYNSTYFTAACNLFPMNTWIRVTNLKNNKSVIVLINDRLHVKSTRLVDLSKDAAGKLGFTGKGLAHVKVEVLPGFKPSARS